MNATTKTNQFFRAIMLLSKGRYYSPKQLAEELNIEPRTMYRYVEDLRTSPFFTLDVRGKRIRISRESLFWTNIMNSLYLTDNEAQVLSKFLDELHTDDRIMLSLKRKVRDIVGNYIPPLEHSLDAALSQNIALIQTAIDNQRMCLLRGYTSLHSDTKTDRLVEPFAFLGSKNDVRCYEVATQRNKTFKLSRLETVEILDVDWQFAKKHKQMFTDIFHFSDETKTRVRLLMGNLSKTILIEEYPEARTCIIPQRDGRWMLDAEFCSMKGVGRFYLGLFEDIEIYESPEFQEYLTDRIQALTKAI